MICCLPQSDAVQIYKSAMYIDLPTTLRKIGFQLMLQTYVPRNIQCEYFKYYVVDLGMFVMAKSRAADK